MIKTFRGLMETGDITRLCVHTNDGKTGYKIVKFEATPYDPAAHTIEGIFKVFTQVQTLGTEIIDWSDNTMIASLYLTNYDNPGSQMGESSIIVDDAIFNQDLYITFVSKFTNTYPANYYIELEQMPLDLNESTVATLQSLRSSA